MATETYSTDFSPRTGTVYADAATRGRLRQWKLKLASKYRRLNRLWEQQTLDADITAICSPRSIKGRSRAFTRVAAKLAAAGATLEGVRLEGNAPLAVWSILKPRDSVTAEPDDPADAQNCLTVNYILAGSFPNMIGHGEGLWTLEIPDHALGRLMQRYPGDPAPCVAAAHHAALRLRYADVIRNGTIDLDFSFLLPAGPGAFVCTLRHGPDMSIGGARMVHVRCHTWLADSMLRDDQTPLIDDGAPGDRLGDSWLLPAPIKRVVMNGKVAVVERWGPGLPDLMAAPQGRA